MKANPHPKQTERLKALYRYDILDTPRESDFDEIAELASQICETPISIVTFIEEDRQWFKAEVGTGMTGTSTEVAICSHALLQEDLMVIPDTLHDPRTINNPLVSGDPKLRFYAGALLKSSEGLPIGTLCVLDLKPRELSEKQKFALEVLSKQVMAQLELRLALKQETAARQLAEKKIEEQNILAAEIDHRVKNSLQMVSSLLRIQGSRTSNEETKDILKVAENRVRAIASLHSELHSISSFDNVRVDQFIARLADNLEKGMPSNIQVKVDLPELTLVSSKAGAIGIILNEFVANSFKYAFPDDQEGRVLIEGHFVPEGFLLQLCDNGIGYSDATPMTPSKGLGMRIISASVSQLGGTLTINKATKGAHISILLPLTDEQARIAA